MFLTALKDIIWGMPTVFFIISVGVYFTVKSGFFQITGIQRIAKETIGSLKSEKKIPGEKQKITPFMALATAVGGTVGVGSIVGVGYAIATGGVGSIFWMWVSGFFGMMIKYAEVAIAVKYRKKTEYGYAGGPMYCLKDMGYKKLAVAFCLLCIFASIGVGNLAQTNAVAVILDGVGISPVATAVVLSLFFALIIIGGQQKIARISAFVVPLVSLVYMIATLYVLLSQSALIPSAFIKIFKEAFGFKAALGGFSGAMISQAARVGFARGIFSNEAGMGSSPIAHASAENARPHTQGMWGITEIFIDTFVVSTVTALILICAGLDDTGELFSVCFGRTGPPLLAFSLTIFAYASMISWCYYSEGCIKFLTRRKGYLSVYRILSVAGAFAGCLASMSVIWDLADVFNGLMIFPNMFLLILKRREITEILKKG